MCATLVEEEVAWSVTHRRRAADVVIVKGDQAKVVETGIEKHGPGIDDSGLVGATITSRGAHISVDLNAARVLCVARQGAEFCK
jgi:hypothetical protein